MDISLSELSEVKGIGKKTIQRIRKYKLADEGYISKYDESLHLDRNSVNKGDCLELMNGIPDNSIDLIITDPPYGIDYQFNNNKNIKFDVLKNDNKPFNLTEYLNQFKRIIKNKKGIYIFTRFDIYPKWYKEINSFFKIKNCIVWNKTGRLGAGDLKGQYGLNHEFIIYATNGRHILNEKREKDVWKHQRTPKGEYCGHPTQKPTKLISKIIKKSSEEGDVILDPFAGGGSTGIAAQNTNRDYILIEKEQKYIDIIKDRLRGGDTNAKNSNNR